MKMLRKLQQARQNAKERRDQIRAKAHVAEMIQRHAITAVIEKEHSNREHRTCAGYHLILVKRKED